MNPRVLVDLATAFLTIGLVEAVIKPIAKRVVQTSLSQSAGPVLAFLDRQMPSLLQAYRGHELEQVVRSQLEQVKQGPATQEEVDEVFRLLDVRITADRLHAYRPVNPNPSDPSA